MNRTGLSAHPGRRGAAVVEASLILMLFLVLLFSIFDFAFATFQRQTILHSARTAARWGVVAKWDCDVGGCDPAPQEAATIEAITNMVVYGSPEGGTHGIFGLTPSMVHVTRVGMRHAVEEKLVITVDEFPLIFITPGFSGRYTGRPITVCLSMEEYAD